MQLYMKGLQMQVEKELTSMREALKEKSGENQAEVTKNKEKNIALFNEVVRLGQELESQGMQLAKLNSDAENKMQELDQRLGKAEQDSSNAENVGGNYTALLSRFSEKTEKRVSELENTIQILLVFLLIII